MLQNTMSPSIVAFIKSSASVVYPVDAGAEEVAPTVVVMTASVTVVKLSVVVSLVWTAESVETFMMATAIRPS